VGMYMRRMVEELVQINADNRFILFGSSLRKRGVLQAFCRKIKNINPSVRSVIIPLPPTLLDLMWNVLHIIPITWFTGHMDVFWSSDWTQPPLHRTKGITTIHDVSFLLYPESFAKKIVVVQKRRLKHIKKECQHFLCDSEATKSDVQKILDINPSLLSVVYPGFSLNPTS